MTNEELRQIENASIRNFVQKNLRFLKGKVLDYGCGKSPYQSVIEAVGSHYHGYDRRAFPANVSGEDVGSSKAMKKGYDSILCTQVIQYVPHPDSLLGQFQSMLPVGGVLMLTYPTTWPIVESEDLWRFTKAGMDFLVSQRFEVLIHEVRAVIDMDAFVLPLGGGVVARAN